MPIQPAHSLDINLNANQDTIETVAEKVAALKTNQGNVLVAFVSVNYDLQLGTASAIENNGTGVQIEFNFAHVQTLINGAMSLLAKQELLRQLQTFNDADINRLITAKSSTSLDAIDRTLFQIQKLGVAKNSFITFSQEPPKPLHTYITQALGDVVSIKSLNQVNDIIQSIIATPTLPRPPL